MIVYIDHNEVFEYDMSTYSEEEMADGETYGVRTEVPDSLWEEYSASCKVWGEMQSKLRALYIVDDGKESLKDYE